MEGLLRMETVCKTSVYNYMFIKGSTEEEVLHKQGEKMTHPLELCQPFLQPSQIHAQCSHDRKDEITRITPGQSYSGYRYCLMPSLQTVYVNVELPIYAPAQGRGGVL